MIYPGENRPLWKAIEEADYRVTSIGGPMYAAEIRAVRDWLLPEQLEPLGCVDGFDTVAEEVDYSVRWAEWYKVKQLRSLLSAEADRAETEYNLSNSH